jgi:excisionase family DNA binding protein
MPRRKKGPTGELLSASQAAELLGVTRQQRYLLVKQGTLPQVEIGGYLLLPRAAVEHYRTTRRVGRPPKKKSS